MNTFNRLPVPDTARRFSAAALIGIVASSSLSACEDRPELHECFVVTIDTGGVGENIEHSLEHKVGIIDFDGFTGAHQTSSEAEQVLRKAHKKYTIVMPDDKFRYCIDGKKISFDDTYKVKINEK